MTAQQITGELIKEFCDILLLAGANLSDINTQLAIYIAREHLVAALQDQDDDGWQDWPASE